MYVHIDKTNQRNEKVTFFIYYFYFGFGKKIYFTNAIKKTRFKDFKL